MLEINSGTISSMHTKIERDRRHKPQMVSKHFNINVFGYEKQEPYPVYISKEKFNDMLNLLLITKENEQHYVLIKDFDKFMHNQTKHKERKHFCMYCLQCFPKEKGLINHKENCMTINGAQGIKMPRLMIWYIFQKLP